MNSRTPASAACGTSRVRVQQIVAIYRQSLGEFVLIGSTTAAIIVLPIEQGVAMGIALSLLHGIWSTTRARIVVFERVPGTSVWWPPSPHIRGVTEPDIIVAGFAAPLSFLNAYRFRQDMLNALGSATSTTRLIVLEATGILDIDFTAAQMCARAGITLRALLNPARPPTGSYQRAICNC
jgi:sulfate permease, SulP family